MVMRVGAAAAKRAAQAKSQHRARVLRGEIARDSRYVIACRVAESRWASIAMELDGNG
jgi:hypothetical protein